MEASKGKKIIVYGFGVDEMTSRWLKGLFEVLKSENISVRNY